jgi:RNA polymerase sigma-70 factor (ECF subfamily)
MSAIAEFEEQRSRLRGIAYGILGSVVETEDVVQDAFLRWQSVDRLGVQSAEAFLTTIVTRLAIDRLRALQRRREDYLGPWLPEPVVGDVDGAEAIVEAEALSLALLATLERLNPVERAVLILRDVFDFEYEEIAGIVEKTPANCRQIARRARTRVTEPVRRFQPTPEQEQALVAAFSQAVENGELEALQNVLAQDVVLWSDGGDKVAAARQPIFGASNVARFLLGITRTAPPDAVVTPVRVNGDPGFRLDTSAGPFSVLALELRDERIAGIRIIVNPDKLQHLR